jgi:glycosyltransferase involved in cell wall biosynthesis
MWRRSRARAALKRLVMGLPDLAWWPRLRRRSAPRVLFGVHTYLPTIGGVALQVSWMAEHLRARGWDCWVYAPRTFGEPRRVNGIPVVASRWVARHCDVVFTYSANAPQRALGAYVIARAPRPRYLHFPCSMFPDGKELIGYADTVLVKTPKDLWATEQVCGSGAKAVRVVHAAPESRRGRRGEFRKKYAVANDYILWVGAWMGAKGVRNLSERFAAFRARHPARPLTLVMFGGYGRGEYPIAHPDIVTIDRNADDVPSALADCLFVAFNSPPAPLGFDANPTILFEALLNGKTFVAQQGTPVLDDIGHLGMVVASDDAWLAAAEALVFDAGKRGELEAACRRAYEETFNYRHMMAQMETVLRGLLGDGSR